jgi:hypothetical protein
MDPTIVGALIGGGIALVGIGVAVWQTRFSARAQLREKRSVLYAALLAYVSEPLSFKDMGRFNARAKAFKEFRPQVLESASQEVRKVYDALTKSAETLYTAANNYTSDEGVYEHLEEFNREMKLLDSRLAAELQGPRRLRKRSAAARQAAGAS